MSNPNENGTPNGVGNTGIIGFNRGEFILDDDGSNLIETGEGSDIIIGAGGNDTISTGDGFDFISLGADPDGANEVYAGRHADIILGGGGNELLDGGAGHDFIHGGAGDDTIIGGKGNDTLTGGDGADTFVLHENDGDDLITDFDVSADVLQVEAGFNDGAVSTPEDMLSFVTYNEQGAVLEFGRHNMVTLEGVAEGELTADNFVVIGDGDDDDGDDEYTPGDPVVGDDEDNLLEGTDESELLFGAAGNDTLIGGAGDDTLRGGQGDDVLDGGDGNDVLISGQGADSMTGGEGDDVFVYLFGHGEDTILDFNLAGDDRVRLQAEMGETLLLSTEQVLDLVVYNEEGAVIDFGDENSLTLIGVQEGSLTADDFELIG